MSDRFYGEVRFPVWARKYIPDEIRVQEHQGLLVFEEEEARYGKPWLADYLGEWGIPHDVSSSEYFEYKAEESQFRFLPDGRTEEHSRQEGATDMAAEEVLSVLEAQGADALRNRCLALIEAYRLPGPDLHEITEEAWLEWTKLQGNVFLWNLGKIPEKKVFYPYRIEGIFNIPAPEVAQIGDLVGHWDLVKGAVTLHQMRELQKEFPEVWFIWECSRLGIFVPNGVEPSVWVVSTKARKAVEERIGNRAA